MKVDPESRGLRATRGNETATPALHLLYAVSLTESETHFQDAGVVDAHETQEPADGRRQAFAALFLIIVHSAAFPYGERTQEQLERLTVAQPPPDTQAPARPVG